MGARVPRKRQAWAVWSLTAIYLLLYVASFFISIYFGNLLGGFVWPLIATQLVFGLAYTPFTTYFTQYIPLGVKPVKPEDGGVVSTIMVHRPTSNHQDVPLLHQVCRRRLPSLVTRGL